MNSLNIITLILGGIVLFVLGREIVAWYFKTNKIIAILERIEENTRPKGLTRESLEKSDQLV